MQQEDIATLVDDANLPPLVRELLAEGQAVVEGERRRKELEEEAAAGARRAILNVNSQLAAEALVQLEPKVARLMPWAFPVEDTLAFQSPPEFQEMRFLFKPPGFRWVIVKVRRSWKHVCQPVVGRQWEPWQIEEPFAVVGEDLDHTTRHPSLGIALAHAREQWLKENKDLADVPF